MKPCAENRKLIAWLALDALDAPQARVLRGHLPTCEGCRRYLAEISNVTANLAATKTADIQTSESFHQRVAGRLRTTARNPVFEFVVANFFRLNWRMVSPAMAALVVAIVAFAVLPQHPIVPPPRQFTAQITPAPGLDETPPPTFANYQKVANQSLEKLDELLTREGNQNFSPAPVYTALTFPRANGSF
jgi:anti-sigma factor RsiW